MAVDPPSWVRDAVFYQIFPDRFATSDRVAKPGPLEAWDAPPTNHGFKGGDLLGILEHLDHIQSLGATALYLTPVFQSASNHRYHTYDYFTVDPLLGGNAALRELIDAVHARGMRLILDGVFNHTGRGFWAFHHVLETGSGSPYRNWFVYDQEALDRGVPLDAYPASHARVGVGTNEPPLTPVDGIGDSLHRLGYQAWWDVPALPKLNIAEPAVREHIFQVAEHWIRFGADGWRLDVPGEIQDPAFWAEFRRRCRAANPEAYLVGEIWMLAPDWVSDERFDALMHYPLAKAVLGFAGAGSLDRELLNRHDEYAEIRPLDGPGFAARLREILGAYPAASNAVQLNLLSSHDAPRIASIVSGDRAALKLAMLLQATLPGAPCVYYGDEVGLEGGVDPDNRRAFPWDTGRWNHEVLEATRSLFALRHAEPLLRHGELEVVDAADAWVALRRSDPASPHQLLVVVNTGGAEARIPWSADRGRLELVALPVFEAARLEPTDGGMTAIVAGRSGAVARISG